MITLDVRGLPKSMTDGSLQALYSQHGRVFGLRMARDLFSGECRGFAQLEMEGHEARGAMAALNGSTHDGATIRVTLHEERGRQRRR